ncbi:MAG TPA: DUF1015 domain-containing protein [Acidimicrobiales bacterium]|nr:DUF1015 domain-containing protein [Acidimicrobiales bacterium]
MPRFEPFAGLRYSPEQLVRRGFSLDAVIAPPYDVIDDAQRSALAARCPFNSVLVELPSDEPERGADRYQVAAELFSAWQQQGILVADPGPAFYVYQMDFEDPDGGPRHTRGVIGALEVVPEGRPDVLPHERTLPKPKGDRLELLRACRANLSPVWGLSLAEGLSQLLRPSGPPDSAATDDQGVRHLMWRMDDPAHLDLVAQRVGSAAVVIADGHHRYETARAYDAERRAEQGGRPGDHSLVMALVVELSDAELRVRPIHRLLGPGGADRDLVQAMAGAFVLEPWSGERGQALLAAMGDRGGPCLVTPQGAWLMRARPETRAGAALDLDSIHLEAALERLPGLEVSYEPDLSAVLAKLAGGQASAAVLVRPATVAQIAECARSGLRMPPKTTLFDPKPRTGMVFRRLAD